MAAGDITLEEVRRIAGLARLSLEDDEAAALTTELARIVEFVDSLSSVDLSAVDSTLDASPTALRDDEPVDGLPRETTLGEAPRAHDGHFIVPKVVD